MNKNKNKRVLEFLKFNLFQYQSIMIYTRITMIQRYLTDNEAIITSEINL